MSKMYSISKKDLIFMFVLLISSWLVLFFIGFEIANRIYNTGNKSNKFESRIKMCESELSSCKLKLNNSDVGSNNDQNKTSGENSGAKSLAIKELSSDIIGKYTVQIGAYKNEIDAQQLAYALYRQGNNDSYYMETRLAGKGIWYRVSLGFFDRKSSASAYANMLIKQGKIKSYMVRRLK